MAPRLPTTGSPRLPPSLATNRAIAVKIATAAAAAATAAAAASLTLTAKSAGRPIVHSASPTPLFADVAMTFAMPSVDPNIRKAFLKACSVEDRLLHVGIVKKDGIFSRAGKVYAFGVYADANDLKQKLKEYQRFSFFELKNSAELINDVLERDIRIRVRLLIVDEHTSFLEVRKEIATLVESRVRKLGGLDRRLLESFVSLVKDKNKSLKGSTIELSRKLHHELKISIDDKEVGNIKSKLLCKSILDLYVGDNSLDKKAKFKVQEEIARLLMQYSG